ncbi:MAG: hypothetical protein ACPGYV_10935 [Phycisphaeraceae bacterium]
MRLRMSSILCLSVVACAGCLPSEQPATRADLRATDTASRVPALVDAGDRDDPASLAELVRALSDKDPVIRLYAARALRERTGAAFDYRYYASSDERQQAIARWRDHLSTIDGPYDADPTAHPTPDPHHGPSDPGNPGGG